jgi:predicted Zn-dependent protease
VSAGAGWKSGELALAERALALAPAGADHAQVSVTRERSLVHRFARSAATQATAVDDLVVEFLCVADGHPAAASTNSADPEALASASAAARSAAEAAARLAGVPGPLPGLPGPAPARVHVGHDAATAALDPQPAGLALRAAFEAAAQRSLEAFGIWTAGEVRVAIVSSAGVAAQDAVTDAHMRVTCRDRGGRSGYAAHTAVSHVELDGGELAARAAGFVDARQPLDLPPGEYPVVLDAEAVGTILDFLGDLAFNGLAHAEGRGALAGLLGTRVAAPCINLSDSPRLESTLPRAFDAEGVPKTPLPLIQDGVAHRVVHDTRSAARARPATRWRPAAPRQDRPRRTWCWSEEGAPTRASWPLRSTAAST